MLKTIIINMKGEIMKVLFMANIPSPYRVDFLNELGKKCNLTVTFEGGSSTERSKDWKGREIEYFNPIFLKGKRIKSDQFFCPSIVKVLKEKWDHIIVGGYSSPTAMLAIEYMRIKKIPFWLEADGGIVTKETRLKYWIKKHFISAASYWLSSGGVTTEYFVHYGAKRSNIYLYPFTSLLERDFAFVNERKTRPKSYYKQKLGIKEEKIVLSVGRFSYDAGYGKGYDVLLKVAEHLPSNVGIYIVGDEPTEEFINWKREKRLSQVHFIGFKNKTELSEFYLAADIFVLLTRGDVWGLVINEAMMHGLPIITTEHCVAGLELVRENENGYIVSLNDISTILKKVSFILENKEQQEAFSGKSLQYIKKYTIENMAEAHAICLGKINIVEK